MASILWRAFVLAAALAAGSCGSDAPSSPTPPTPHADLGPPLTFYFFPGEKSSYGPDLWAFRSDPQRGVLTRVSQAPTNVRLPQVGVHPTRRYVYVVGEPRDADRDTQQLRTYRVGDDGSLTPQNELILPGPHYPQQLVFDPKGRRLYIVGLSGAVVLCSLSADGTPQLVTADAFPARDVRGLGATSDYAYAVMHRGTEVFRVDAAGRPAGDPLQHVDGQLGGYENGPRSVLSPSSDLLVAWGASTAYRGNGIVAYAPDPKTGRLAPVGGGALAASALAPQYPGLCAILPQTLVIHPSGRFVYVNESIEVCYHNPTHTDQWTATSLLTGYRVDPEGTLARIPGTPMSAGFPDGFTAGSLQVSPDGSFLYVEALIDRLYPGIPGIPQYRIDPQTGALTPMPELAFLFPKEWGYY
jgi:hypothetical protein